MLGVRHAARQYGNVGDRLVRDPAVLHGFHTLLLGVALGMPFWIGVALVVAGSLINLWFARRS